MREPMHELVTELRRAGFEVSSATREMSSAEPLLKMVTPDTAHTILVKESEYFDDPDGLTASIRMQLRLLGYST